MTYNEIETFCQEHGFLFHKNGSGTFGADRYWTFTKVENNTRTVFFIAYYPVRNCLKVRTDAHTYQGVPESLAHMQELLTALRVMV